MLILRIVAGDIFFFTYNRKEFTLAWDHQEYNIVLLDVNFGKYMLKLNTSTSWNIVYYGQQFSLMLIVCSGSQICDITKCRMNEDSESRPEVSCHVLS